MLETADTNIYRDSTEFVTESGFRFPELEIAYKTWGTPNADKSNVVLVFHALTGHASADKWLTGFFGKGRMLDPDKHFIICSNVLGSCYGTTGPLSIHPETGERYAGDFPVVTIRDMVRVQQRLLDHLEVKKIRFALGASMGGMQALEFAIMDDRLEQLILIAMGKAHSAWAIGVGEAQRKALTSDPKWQGGHYPLNDPPSDGLAAARMMGMITYRSAASFEKRFARNLQDEKDCYQVESYLRYQGMKLVERFDAVTYMRLTQAMDSHDVARNRGTYEEVLGRLNIPVLVIGISSDVLYPVREQKELAALLGNGRYAELESENGHDAFLIEFDEIQSLVKGHFPELTENYKLSVA
ncbi:homoserine O-acetyltransferase [Balneolaceae bacterium ANBcel3]|nr:homoserine O-acetyltransferase [Balneolaceae bacterium ANBcel3]